MVQSRLDDFEKKIQQRAEDNREKLEQQRELVRNKFPLAVRFADRVREVFGPDVKLVYARNEEGEEMGRGLD